jgi:hypothetical protein
VSRCPEYAELTQWTSQSAPRFFVLSLAAAWQSFRYQLLKYKKSTRREFCRSESLTGADSACIQTILIRKPPLFLDTFAQPIQESCTLSQSGRSGEGFQIKPTVTIRIFKDTRSPASPGDISMCQWYSGLTALLAMLMAEAVHTGDFSSRISTADQQERPWKGKREVFYSFLAPPNLSTRLRSFL